MPGPTPTTGPPSATTERNRGCSSYAAGRRLTDPWGASIRLSRCSELVFVDQPAEPVPATDALSEHGRHATLHQLRHSALTHDAEAGASTAMLMARSGNTSTRSLKEVLRPRQRRGAAALAGRPRPRPPRLSPSDWPAIPASVWLLPQSHAQRPQRPDGRQQLAVPHGHPAEQGAKYPPEVLTPAEVAAIIGECSHVRALKGGPKPGRAGRSCPARLESPSDHRGARHPAGGVTDRREPQRRHPAHALIGAIPPVRGRRGRPRQRPDRVYADRGYDHDKYRTHVPAAGSRR